MSQNNLENVSIKSKHPGGRPRISDAEYRGFRVLICLNEFENNKLQERADSVGLGAERNRAVFIRKLITNAKINSIAPISKTALIELNKIGQNLNQLTKLAHSNHEIDSIKIDQIHADIKKISQNLFGENN